MKRTVKILAIGIALLLITTTTILGTLSFLTAKKSVINTFTVGKVDITLDETDVDEYGVAVPNTTARVVENHYKLIPGHTYLKDPTVTVKGGSESSYIRIMMTVYARTEMDAIIANARNGLTDYASFIVDLDSAKADGERSWNYVGYTVDDTADSITFEFRYKTAVSGFDTEGNEVDVALAPLFTKIKVPGALTGEELNTLKDGGFKMEIEAHAIQAEGMSSADVAWQEFKTQQEALASNPGNTTP